MTWVAADLPPHLSPSLPDRRPLHRSTTRAWAADQSRSRQTTQSTVKMPVLATGSNSNRSTNRASPNHLIDN
jgi:hypothetical protein